MLRSLQSRRQRGRDGDALVNDNGRRDGRYSSKQRKSLSLVAGVTNLEEIDNYDISMTMMISKKEHEEETVPITANAVHVEL